MRFHPAAALAGGLLSVWLAASPALAAGLVPPANPPINFTDPMQACDSGSTQTQIMSCSTLLGPAGWIPNAVQQLYLRAIDRARAAEELGPLALPVDFSQLGARGIDVLDPITNGVIEGEA